MFVEGTEGLRVKEFGGAEMIIEFLGKLLVSNDARRKPACCEKQAYTISYKL